MYRKNFTEIKLMGRIQQLVEVVYKSEKCAIKNPKLTPLNFF
jgi:hypothetical protein